MGAVCVAAAALTLSPSPRAQAGPLAVVGGETLDVQADRLHVDIQGGTALLEGNVTARMGDLTVACPKIEIRYDEAPQVRWARGSGGVSAIVKGVSATATTLVVDIDDRKVLLSGNVKLMRGRGWVEADRASIDIMTQKVTLHEVKGSIPVQPPKR
jgi:lipopolysaccharide transport protein LptA